MLAEGLKVARIAPRGRRCRHARWGEVGHGPETGRQSDGHSLALTKELAVLVPFRAVFGLTFLFKLHAPHAANSLLALDALFFARLQYFFVLYAEFTTLDVKAIHCGNHSVGVCRQPEIGERQATELTGTIQVIVERVRSGDGQRRL